MKILTKNNGIAMVAVMAVLVIVTLFIPVMFNMGDSALAMAVTGMDQQRASYLARTSAEMTVAAFKQSYNEFIEKVPTDSESTEFKVYNAYLLMGIFDGEVADKFSGEPFFTQASKDCTIESATVYMYVNSQDAEDYIYLPNSTAEDNNGVLNRTYIGTGSVNQGIEGAIYNYVGKGNCSFKFDNSIQYYKIDNDTQEFTEIVDIKNSAGIVVKTAEEQYVEAVNYISGLLNHETKAEYSVSKVSNRNVTFTAQAEVNSKRAVRRCIVVLPTYPSEDGWLFFNGKAEEGEGGIAATDDYGADIIAEGCNQTQFLPDKRSGMTAINYSEMGVTGYKAQVLQIYSCLGNMIISADGIKDKNGLGVRNGVQNSEFILGVSPQLNTSPNDDPNYNIFDGINAASYQDGVQKDNFIAATATNAIRVDLPVQLFVNPARANRVGDGFEDNHSIYKVMTFQAPTIVFNRRVDMMISLYNNPTKDGSDYGGDARRMSSVVLAAPSNTPYSYYNEDRQESVKAGKVFFAEDCYLWVINYGDTGSGYSEHWYEVAQTVYYRDSDFTKIKVASAGDVYYFNTEVPLKNGTNSKKIGLPLSAWALETIYYNDYNTIVTDVTPWWQLWTRAKRALFGAYVESSFRDETFVPSDLYKIGNIYEDPTVQIPDIDDFYTIWEN